MSYPFVSSTIQGGVARGPRLSVVWHMAEGGGTVEHLSGDDPRGVSVHFVVQYTGRIVQMLSLTRMHTSIRTSAIRTTNDPAYDWRGVPIVYGAAAARAVMGAWADTRKTLGPNHASIAVEIEGFARNGPNDKQKDAMARLWADLRGKYPGIRSLGHRDFAGYKACPGKLIPWQEVGGHGATDITAAPEENMGPPFIVKSPPIGKATTTAEIKVITLDGEDWDALPVGTVRNVYAQTEVTGGKYAGAPAYLVDVPDGPPGSTGLLLAQAATFAAFVGIDEDAAFNAGVAAASKAALTAKR